MFHHHLTGDDQFGSQGKKVHHRHRVAIDISLPVNVEARADIKPGRFQADVMTLARSQVQGMRQQGHRFGIAVPCGVFYLYSTHRIYISGRNVQFRLDYVKRTHNSIQHKTDDILTALVN